jgi:hypothetical protein
VWSRRGRDHRGDSFMTKGAGRIRMENGEYPGFPGVRCK